MSSISALAPVPVPETVNQQYQQNQVAASWADRDGYQTASGSATLNLRAGDSVRMITMVMIRGRMIVLARCGWRWRRGRCTSQATAGGVTQVSTDTDWLRENIDTNQWDDNIKAPPSNLVLDRRRR